MNNKNVTLPQLQKSVSSVKNYIDFNKNKIYLDPALLIENNIQTNENGDFILNNENYIIDPQKSTRLFINIPISELKTSYFDNDKDIYLINVIDLNDNNTLYNFDAYGSPSSKQINSIFKFNSVNIIIGMNLNKKIELSEDGTSFSINDDINYCYIQIILTSKLTSLNITIQYYIQKYNIYNLSSFDLVPGKGKYSLQTPLLEEGEITSDNAINFGNKECGTYSIIMGKNNNIPRSGSDHLLIFGDNNETGRNLFESSIFGLYNNIVTTNSRYIGSAYNQIFGNKNVFTNAREFYYNNIFGEYNTLDYTGYMDFNLIHGEYLNITNPYTMAFGKYADVPATLMFALCNGTSDTDKKVIFGVDRTGLAITDAVPTEDSHLTNKKYVDDKVASLVDSAPETLDTLKELSTALGDDPNFATTMATALGNKVDKVDGKVLSTNDLTNELKANYDAAYTHSQSAHFDGDYNSLTNVPTGLATTEYVDNSVASLEDINKRIEILPIENTHYVIQDGVPASQQNINGNEAYIFNDEQITIPDDLVLENFADKFSAIYFQSNGLLNAIISYNDGTIDITKEVELVSSYNSSPFDYGEYGESSGFSIEFGFDYDINKFYIYIYYYAEGMESPTFYEVTNATISYNYYTNLIRDEHITNIDYSKINNIPYQLNDIVNNEMKSLSIYEYANLFDNLFIWDANKINEQLDSTSGVKQNVYYDHKIKIKQKDSEGIGFGQYIPASTMCDYKLFISAGPDVIVKVYQHETKRLLNEIKDFSIGKYKEIKVMDRLNNSDGIFIAFTVKDDVTDFYANTYINDLILCKSDGFLNKQEVNDKATKQYVDDSISSVVIPTKVSELTNDSGFITSIPDEYITETELTAKNYIDNTTLESKGYLTEHQDISGLALKSELHNHTNKAILDAITSDKISSWDSKSTFSGSYNDLADKPTIPTKTSQLTNDSGYLTEHQSLVGLATETYVNGKVSDLVNSSPEALDTLKELADALGNDPNFATTVSNQIGNKVDKIDGKGLSTNDLTNALKANYDAAYTHSQSVHFSGNYNDLTNKPTIPEAYTHPSTHPASMITGLATVATSGSYNDLANKPTIPTVSNDLTNALKANYDAAYTHSQSAHAPSNAQKNSDITKAEIEAKLTGDVTTHTHSQYLTEHQSLTGYATEEFVNNRLSSLQIVPITQADYDALATKDPNTLYLITTTNAGSIDNENNITLSSDLPSGRYTLKYEDENGQPLSDFDNITTMEV